MTTKGHSERFGLVLAYEEIEADVAELQERLLGGLIDRATYEQELAKHAARVGEAEAEARVRGEPKLIGVPRQSFIEGVRRQR